MIAVKADGLDPLTMGHEGSGSGALEEGGVPADFTAMEELVVMLRQTKGFEESFSCLTDAEADSSVVLKKMSGDYGLKFLRERA